MKFKYTFYFLLILTFSFGQTSINDSLISKFEKEFLYKQNNILKLKPISSLNNDDYFRITTNTITLNLIKNENELRLESLQYVIKSDQKKVIDTLINKVNYKPEIAVWLYTKLKSYNIQNLIPKKNTDNIGRSGVFTNEDLYIEHMDNQKYTIKAFPYSQYDTISKNYTLKNIYDELLEKIEYKKTTEIFKESLPKGYSYRNLSLSYSFYTLANSSFQIDFTGNYRLLIGMSFGYYINKIKKRKLNIGAYVNFQNNLNHNKAIELDFYKSKIFGNNKTYYDSFHLGYEYNELDYIKYYPKFNNFKITYYGNVKDILNFGFGYNRFSNDLNGITLQLSKSFQKSKIDFYYRINYISNNQTNYSTGIQKRLPINTNTNSFSIYTSLYYEKLFDFNCLNFSINIPLKWWTIN